MEEERRLCYVGMTRARQELYMFYASSRLLYGGVNHNPPSRFLAEIDSSFQSNALATDNFQFEAITATSTDEPRYVPDLNEGDAVRHQVFGNGTIMELDGDNAVVYFKGKGSKKLNIAFAPIEKI
jgi:DNA helicase-2/ATP-dependent DNA helicase PcrA